MKEWRLVGKGIKEIHLIRPGVITASVVCMILEAIYPFINIFMSAEILNSIIENAPAEVLIRNIIWMIALNAFVGLLLRAAKAIQSLFMSEFYHLYEYHLARKNFELDYERMEDPETFQKKQRIEEIRNLNGGGVWKLIDTLPKVIQGFVTIGVSVSVTLRMFVSNGSIEGGALMRLSCSTVGTVILCVLILCSIWTGVYANSTAIKKMYVIMDGFVHFNRVFLYYIEHYISSYHAGKDIRLYNQKELIESETEKLFVDADRTLTKLSNNQVKYAGMRTVTSVLALAGVYLFVGLRALAGLFPAGNIVLYINSINQFITGINCVIEQMTALRVNREALQAYFDYMEIPTESLKGKNIKRLKKQEENEIRFENVSFRYPGTEQDVLHHVSFTIYSGKKTAMVGVNGSGKTTIVKLLCRLFVPTEGRILLNGEDIQKFSFEEYRSLLGVVFQDYKLLAFPLGENVAASMEYDVEEVMESLSRAGFSMRMEKMTDGLETPLYKDFDENGVEISGGEAQKIAIARALYKKAPIIIMDEPTAALDPIAEAQIYEKLNEILVDKTAVFISHRLSSCRFCDRILVFEDGRLKQQGRHEELVKDEKGIYFRLWNAQAQYYV